jgi:outer membrane lipoprotein-sorting protein
MDAMRPDRARWDYAKPVRKTVYILGRTVTIVEPELEQAIIKKFQGDIDFFAILSRAERLENGEYLARYGEQRFLIHTENGIPVAITYQDAFENRIRILFSHPSINPTLDPDLFTPEIPEDYDILTE